MSTPDNSTTTNPNAVRDEDFMALKARLEAGEAVHIEWKQVFDFHYGAFMGPNSTPMTPILDALEVLETKPYGQELFRDIILNEARVQPTTITSYAMTYGVTAGSIVAYSPREDSIVYDHGFYERLEKMPPEIAAIALRSIEETHMNVHEVVLLHEGDHAEKMYGADLPHPEEDEIGFNIAVGCFEETAVLRENLYKEDVGLPVRPIYTDIDGQIQGIIRSLQLKSTSTAFLDNIENLDETMAILEARNIGCNESVTHRQIEEMGDERAYQILEALDLDPLVSAELLGELQGPRMTSEMSEARSREARGLD